MHEEALLKDLRRKIVEVARENGAEHVTRVRLWVGALCELNESGLKAAWPRTTKGTAAERSVLEVETSKDLHDPRAEDVILTSLDVEDEKQTAR
jgi:hydrogenase nickel incorporation protein HypA/HybF